MKKEIWKDIPGFDLHEASNIGRIRSKDRMVNHKSGGCHFRSGKILTQFVNKFGYYRVGLSYEPKLITQSVHRLVALAWIDNPLSKRTINHIDGNKSNNHVDNLEWNTHQENVVHSHSTGLTNPAKGMQFKSRIKFDDTQIMIIRECPAMGFTHKQIAEYFNVSRPQITRIVNKVSWAHIA